MREPDFRRLWSAQFVSNIGSWMQTVAAQWVMLSLTTSALLVSAISAAASIPVLLLAVPAGALGDLADRKRLILATQLLMLFAAAALAVLSLASALTPAILLALLFVIGCGTAASAPTWQTLQLELVPAANRSDAIALGSVNQNLARAIGPALGGLLLAATSAAALFAVNAVSFVAVLVAVAVTAVPKRRVTLPVEHALDAARAGGRYVANSPTLLAWRLALPRAISAEVETSEPWALYRQAEDRYELVETFIVGSWAEHERQHARMYPAETAVIDRLEQTLLPGRPRLVQHSLAVRTRHQLISQHDG
jgi:MFS family permease